MNDGQSGKRDLYGFIERPKQKQLRSRPVRIVLLIVLLVAILFGGRTALSYWVDLLWFRSLGYGDVFWTTWRLQCGIFVVFTVATFLILYGAFWALKRAHRADLPSDHEIVIAGQPVNLSVESALRVIAFCAALLIAGVTGAAIMHEWPALALFWYASPAASSAADPIFGKPIAFFLFTLPAWHLIVNWLLTLSVITTALAVLFLLVTSGARSLYKGRNSFVSSPWRALSIATSCLLFVLAINVYVDRFDRLLEHHTIFEGVTYTDAHVMLTGLLIVCAALVLGAVIAAVNAWRQPRGKWLVAAIFPAALCYAVLGVVSWYVGNFVVKPNELVREQPYIVHNIELTRQAYGLDRFLRREFPAETSVEATEPANNQATLQNIRLWDWRALQDTLRQVQEIRTYYDFPDIDIDRYELDGALRQVMLATRELNVEKLPESSRNWINEKLVYTHGYGITMNPVNGFTPEGLPMLLLSNMPVQSTAPSLSVSRPEIYFGELTDTDVYVKTRQQEFDYPQGQTNSLTSYQGHGGIALGGFLRRIILALDRGDLAKLPFSDDVNAQSRLLMRRNVRDRVASLAPFLTFDRDPYIVVDENGRLSWMMDAFTTSDSYPYSSHYTVDGRSINYMRNSVKVVIDAYDGTTTFYVFDTKDPILATYRRIFPRLFKDAELMPAGLRKHVRYPELLFKLQSEVYGLYHMTNPVVFFNREDLWTVATETGLGNNGEQTKQPMQPNFVLMKLPGETGVEFVEILPFTPARRNNLIGWIAGRCDGTHYGTSVVYDFPKTKLVDGPQQIESRIDQNAQLSGQLTLWNQQGSHVLRGNLLVIPSGRALLYAEPIYLQAQQSPMPELRLVVLALQDRLAYGPTFEAALASLYGGEVSSPRTAEAPQPSRASLTPDLRSLIAEAGKDLTDYQRLTAEGKLGEAGKKLEELKRVIDRLNADRK
ncbi:MAG: UPF0182 family protein [Acidobacteria bacterium]|nr:UPF0182 family protein [Acidobacteriota bacterium]